MEFKVRFCKLKCTQGQGSLHRILKIKDGIQCRETKNWWLTTYLLTLKSKCSHPPDRAASVEWTKMTTSLTMLAVTSSRFLKLLTGFHKIQPIEIFYDFRSTKPEKSRSRCSAMRCHAPPKASEDRGLLLRIRTNPDFISRKWHCHH